MCDVLPVSLSAGSHDSWIGLWTLEQCVTCVMIGGYLQPRETTESYGYDLETIRRGVVLLETKLPSSKTKKCKLDDVLYVPKLFNNLLSLSNLSDVGKTTRFG